MNPESSLNRRYVTVIYCVTLLLTSSSLTEKVNNFENHLANFDSSLDVHRYLYSGA